MTSPKIAIVGAGPVGCTLARLLSLSSIDVTVFEGEPSPNYRSQGGTLDLHTETGLAVMKDAGLWDEFIKYARYDGESLLITDHNLKVYMQIKPTAPGDTKYMGRRPEIDRASLRQILTESLPEGMVRWGHHLKEVTDDGTLVFQHTTISGFDLIVGADGVWSKVRNRLSDTKPFYSGVACHELLIPDAANTAPDIYALVNRGSVFAHRDGHKYAIQQLGDGNITVYTSFRTDSEKWADSCDYDVNDVEQVKAAQLAGEYADWHPLLREAISKCSGRTNTRSLYMLPVGFSWEHRKGFTVIGDASHAMTPFAGEGVNLGMEDARRLAKAIISAKDDLTALDGNVAAFEKGMFARAKVYTQLTNDMTKAWFYTKNSPRDVMPRAMSLQVKFHSPKLLAPLASAGTYSYFSVKNLFT